MDYLSEAMALRAAGMSYVNIGRALKIGKNRARDLVRSREPAPVTLPELETADAVLTKDEAVRLHNLGYSYSRIGVAYLRSHASVNRLINRKPKPRVERRPPEVKPGFLPLTAERLQAHLQAGIGYRRIAKLHDMAPSTVRRIILQGGPLPTEEVLRAACERGLTRAEISAELKISQGQLKHLMSKYVIRQQDILGERGRRPDNQTLMLESRSIGYAGMAAKYSVHRKLIAQWMSQARQEIAADALRAAGGVQMTDEEFVAQFRDQGGRSNRADGYVPMSSSLAGAWSW